MKSIKSVSLKVMLRYIRQLEAEDAVAQRHMLEVKREILAKLSARLRRPISMALGHDTTYC